MMCDVAPTVRAARCVRRGFTLVELVVVLLLVAVATAVTAPAFLREPEYDEMTLATQRIELLLRLARDSAVKLGQPVTVSIDSLTGTAWLVAGADAAPAEASRRAGDLNVAPGESLGLPGSVQVQLAAARARFRFIPGGAAFGDTIVLRSGAHFRSITVNPWSGDAYVF